MSAAEEYLAAIEARVNAATEGPWRARDCADDGTGCCTWVAPSDTDGQIAGTSDFDDAAFIASARQDVPALAAALRAVLEIAFDPDTVTALEHGVIDGGFDGPQGISKDEAIGYGVDALRDIRFALNQHLGEPT